MKKLVNVFVPATREQFDLFVPIDLEIKSLTALISESIVELSNGQYRPSVQNMLTMRNPDILLHPERTLQEYNVDDGSELVLF